jgi:hypothetical protein
MPAARLIILCSIADQHQHFLENQERKVQTVIGFLCCSPGLHRRPASLIPIFTNPNSFRAVANVKSTLVD